MKYRYREDRPADDRPWKIQRPKGMREYILEHCQETNYIVFSGKENWCYCTGCGEMMDMNGLYLAHSKDKRVTTVCPKCGRDVVPKDVRYGRKKLTDRGRIVWTKVYGAVTFLEVDEFIIDYMELVPQVWVAPVEQIRLSAKEQTRVDWEEGWWDPGHWVKVKTIGLKAKPCQCYGISNWHDHVWLIHDDVGTDLRYADADPVRFDDGHWDEEWMIRRWIRYLSEFLKYPSIELLEKSGFQALVSNRASGGTTKAMNIRGRSLRSILKLNNGDVRKLREIDPTMGFLEDVRSVRNLVPGAAIEDIQEISEIIGGYMPERDWEMIRTTADIRKVVVRFLEERRATGDHITLRDYADYISAVNKLGRRLDKKTVYPSNFMAAHEEATDAVAMMGDKEEFPGFQKSQHRITGMEEPWVMGRYMIRPAESPSELRKESQALSHCVRTYVSRVAAGHTSILFIREIEKPDVPFYTLELSPSGMVIQCRGDHNKRYPEDVAEFIKAWKAWWDKMMKKRKVA